MPADRRLFDSSSMTPPHDLPMEAVSNNIDPDDDIIFITRGFDVARGTQDLDRPSPLLSSIRKSMRDMEEYIEASFTRDSIANRRALLDYIGVRFVLNTGLPEGWCRFTGTDGLEYGGPLSRMPKGVVGDEMTVASDIWEALRTVPERV